MKYEKIKYPNGFKKVIKEKNVNKVREENNKLIQDEFKKEIQEQNNQPKDVEIENIENIPKKPNIEPIQKKEKLIDKTSLNIFPLDEAYSKGTLFKDLYKPYKNINKLELDEKEDKSLFDINKYNFAILELQLYLEMFPANHEARLLLDELKKDYVILKDKLSKTKVSTNIPYEEPQWNWKEDKLPWKGGD